MKSLAQHWQLIPAQEWNQAHIDIGMIYLVKKSVGRRVKLARAGTLQYLAGHEEAEAWGEGLINDRRAARKWFLDKGEAEAPKKRVSASSLSSTWEWPPQGTDKEFAEAGKQAIVAVPHTLSYGPQDWLINKTSDFKLEALVDFLAVLLDKMGAACATADKYSIQDMRQHILADNFKDEMRKNWSLRFDKDQLKIAMKKLDIEPKAKDVLHFTVVTEIACVSYALADKSSETAANIGGGTEGACAELKGGFNKSNAGEVAGTTLLLGFREAEFSVVYPKDTTEACSIKSWEKGVGLACKFKGAGAEASSSKPQQQQLFSRILCDILEARGEVLDDLFASESEEAEDDQQQQQQQEEVQQHEQQEPTVGDKRHAAPAQDQPAAKARRS